MLVAATVKRTASTACCSRPDRGLDACSRSACSGSAPTSSSSPIRSRWVSPPASPSSSSRARSRISSACALAGPGARRARRQAAGALGGTLPTPTPPPIAAVARDDRRHLGAKQLRPHWPGMLIAVAVAAAATRAARPSGRDHRLAVRRHPAHAAGAGAAGHQLRRRSQAVLPSAVSFALLGAIETLLSAVVADGMTGRRHRSNCELVAQGVANIASSLFGGICVTGTIARTATNVRAGAHGPVAGMLHARVPAAVHAARGAARELHPARGLARRARRRRLEHGREARRSRRCCARRSGEARRAARDIPADGVPRPNRGDRRRLRARLRAVHPPDVALDAIATHTALVEDDRADAPREGGSATTRRSRPTRTS